MDVFECKRGVSRGIEIGGGKRMGWVSLRILKHDSRDVSDPSDTSKRRKRREECIFTHSHTRTHAFALVLLEYLFMYLFISFEVSRVQRYTANCVHKLGLACR